MTLLHDLTSAVTSDTEGIAIERFYLRMEPLSSRQGQVRMPRPTRHSMSDYLDFDDTIAMVKGNYIGPILSGSACSCGCRRDANPLNGDGLSKPCADLAWYKALR